jgi:hypothetical protein
MGRVTAAQRAAMGRCLPICQDTERQGGRGIGEGREDGGEVVLGFGAGQRQGIGGRQGEVVDGRGCRGERMFVAIGDFDRLAP